MQSHVRSLACFLGALTCLALALVATTPSHATNSGLPPGAESDAPEDQPAPASDEKPAATAPQTPAAGATAPTATTPPPATPAPAAATTTPATTPAAEGAAAAPAAPPETAVAPTPPADPIIAAVRTKLIEPGFITKADKDDITAAVTFYGARTGAPLWVDANGFSSKAKTAIEEVMKADDWGLQASQFDLPTLADGQSAPDVLAAAEAKLTLELLKYARYAKGGRVNPPSLSRIMDVVPPIKDPKVVITELEGSAAPDAYLRGLHPKHEQFQRLREALLKARGPTVKEEEVPVDEALKIKLPKGNTIKVGTENADIALLRQRLKVPAEAGAKDTLLDEKLAQAIKDYQAKNGLKATGNLTSATRTALNREGEPKKAADPGSEITRLVINMERWRWLPDDMGKVYVWNNIPEFYTRVYKGNEEIFKEKIIVGQPSWATPVFSANMQFIIFNPSWGVPDGIKSRELSPRLRAAGGGFLFFGGGGGGSIIRAYGFNVYRGGRQIDPDSVDWTNADLRAYSFVQPPGGKNPLGIVKFRFPNKHDVYMHDTTERQMFTQSNRALSHGCIRVQNPRRLAEVLLEAGNDYSEAKVANTIAGGGEITLEHQIPVHMTYFTAMVDDTGRVSTFSDIYGHDSRLSAALTGRALKLESAIETSSADADGGDPYASAREAPVRRAKKVKQSYSGPDSLADAITGLFSN
jgi:murein L,D-transpeptidase YcbB/YkuD